MLSLAVPKLPEGPAWSYELKFDGYRALGLKADERIQLLSRNGKNFTKRFALIAQALEKLPDETLIDGEIVAFDSEGRPSFNVVQNHRSRETELQFYVFDLLILRGKDLIQQPLEKRREVLRTKVMPGVSAVTSSIWWMLWTSSVWEVKAVRLIGTSCSRSSRRVAVTTISSRPEFALDAGFSLVCAHAEEAWRPDCTANARTRHVIQLAR